MQSFHIQFDVVVFSDMCYQGLKNVKSANQFHLFDEMLGLQSDGMLTSTVYRKPTHTDRYLHFKSHHPNHVKRGE